MSDAGSFTGQLLGAVEQAVIATDTEGRIIFWNRSAENLYGWSADEVVGSLVHEIVPAAEAVGESQTIMDELSQGGRWHGVFRVRRKDGSTFLAQVTDSPVLDEQGRQYGVVGVSHDVTDQVHAHEQLIESEARFRLMADGLPLPVWVHGPDGGQQYVNETFHEFFGSADTSGDRWTGLLHPDDAAGYADAFATAVRTRSPFEARVRVRRSDGSWRWFQSWGTPRFGESGEYLGHVGASTDVTDRLAAEEILREGASRHAFLAALEESLRQSTEALEAQRNALDLLVDHLHATGALFALRHDDAREFEISVQRGVTSSAYGRLADVGDAEEGLAVGRLPRVVLVVSGDAGRRWTADEIVLVQDCCFRVWTTLEQLRSVAEARERRQTERRALERAELMADLLIALEASGDWRAAARRLVDVLSPRFADAASLAIAVSGQPALVLAADGHPPTSTTLQAGGLVPARLETTLDLGGAGSALLTVSRWHPDRPSFDIDDEAFVQDLSVRAGVVLARLYLREREHEIAHRLQRALLPDRLASTGSVSVAGRYVAAGELLDVGGDWYDSIAVADGRLLVAVGDVVGHSLDSAAVMGRLRAGMAALAASDPAPGPLLTALDRFAGGPEGTDFSTVCCALIDPGTGEVEYASAGHPPMLLIEPDGRRTWLEDGRSAPLCSIPFDERPQASVRLGEGTLLLLYSDGLVERRRRPLSVGLERLAAAAARLRHRDVSEICDLLIDELTSDTTREDDVVVLAVRFEQLEAGRFRMEFPAEPGRLATMRAELRSWLDDQGFDRATATDVLLAVGEASANAVEHAFRDAAPGTIDIEVGKTVDGHIRARVRDGGSWRGPGEHSEGRGRGIGIMESLSTDVQRHVDDVGTTITMWLPASKGSGG